MFLIALLASPLLIMFFMKWTGQGEYYDTQPKKDRTWTPEPRRTMDINGRFHKPQK